MIRELISATGAAGRRVLVLSGTMGVFSILAEAVLPALFLTAAFQGAIDGDTSSIQIAVLLAAATAPLMMLNVWIFKQFEDNRALCGAAIRLGIVTKLNRVELDALHGFEKADMASLLSNGVRGSATLIASLGETLQAVLVSIASIVVLFVMHPSLGTVALLLAAANHVVGSSAGARNTRASDKAYRTKTALDSRIIEALQQQAEYQVGPPGSNPSLVLSPESTVPTEDAALDYDSF